MAPSKQPSHHSADASGPPSGPSATAVRPPHPDRGFGPVQPVFRPVDIRVRGTWRFGVLRAWCNGPGGWLAMVEYGDDATARATSTAWFAYDPACIIRLSLPQRPGSWSPPPAQPRGGGAGAAPAGVPGAESGRP